MDDHDAYRFISERFSLVTEFRHGLSGETDRGCALMAGEYLSDQLSELLKAYFVDDAKVCDPLLEHTAFATRINLAYLLGLISPVARRELILIKDVRNEFAHEYKPLVFTNDAIAAKCHALRAHNLFPDPSPRVTFVRTVMGLLGTIHTKIAVITHRVTSKDWQAKMSEEKQQKLKAELEKRVLDAFMAKAERMEISEEEQQKVLDEVRKEMTFDQLRKLIEEFQSDSPSAIESKP